MTGGTSGILFVVSAPSGTGKSTVSRRLLAEVEGLAFSVSYTTRSRRDGERSGRDYHFVDRSRFEKMIDEGEFLEWANVFGELYGTGSAATRAALDSGSDVLLDIDVEGARQVRASGQANVSMMLLPPDYATLHDRLQGRGSEDERQLAGRLSRAKCEAESFRDFDYVVVNDDLDETVDRLKAIVSAESCRVDRNRDRVDAILTTFPAQSGTAKE